MSLEKQTILHVIKPENDIIKPEEDNLVSQNSYSKVEIDLRFTNLEQKIDAGFEKQILHMEKMFSDFKLAQHKEKEENKKWLIALTMGSLLSIIGIVVSIIAIIVRSK